MLSINGLILTGGKSSRLGQEKAFINYHGKPQVMYLYDLLQSLGLDVFISCNPDQVTSFQRTDRLLIDKREFIGPIGGIFTAMSAQPDRDWLVVACDMPMISKKTLQHLLDHDEGQRIITYKSKEKAFPEVLLTIYKKEIFPAIRQAVENENYSLQRLLKEVETRFIAPEDEITLVNVNTAEDLAKINRLIKGK
ncbi:molybdenum cofactor guanylyltransferase [Fulvivirgaceae bacterium BMA12]|uniref:Probable molybdenum cofactor guanylyltransferase n=1 Tax=Agaribacillus aureus TaxID=3051825 RepID=A0ABT8L883_9BACT|nr:molybdenum cofactor guanylyltransferase [Fulvivirgaceae bacterium BMA12]